MSGSRSLFLKYEQQQQQQYGGEKQNVHHKKLVSMLAWSVAACGGSSCNHDADWCWAALTNIHVTAATVGGRGGGPIITIHRWFLFGWTARDTHTHTDRVVMKCFSTLYLLLLSSQAHFKLSHYDEKLFQNNDTILYFSTCLLVSQQKRNVINDLS